MKKLLLLLVLAALSGGCDAVADVIDELDPAPDLNLSVTNASAPALVDEQMAIVLVASNEGEVTATDAEVSLLLPGGIRQFNATGGLNCSNDGFSFCTPGEEVIWSIGDLNRGESRTLVFAVEPDEPNRTLAFTAAFNADNANGVSASTSVRSTSGALHVALTQPSSAVRAGEESEMVVTFVNSASTSISDAILSLTVPSGFELVTAEGGTIDGRRARWELGTVTPGESGEFFVRVLAPSTGDDGELRDSELSVSGSGGTTGTAAYPMLFAPGAYLSSESTANITTIQPGDQASIVVSARNVGGQAISDAEVFISLPGPINQFESPNGTTCANDGFSFCTSGENIDWSLGNLSAGQNRTVTVPIRPDDARGPLVLGIWANGDGASGTVGTLALTVDR